MSWQKYSDYKDSGVEWIGQIPSNWTVRQLRYTCDVQTGDRDTVHRVDDGEYPFFIRSEHVQRIDSWSMDCEAVLTPGDGAVGKVFHHYIGKFDYHQRVYAFFNFRGVTGRYFFHYLSGLFAKVALDGSAKTTVDSLRMPLIKGFFIAHPDRAEQERIARFLDRETTKIDALIGKQEKLIATLREDRAATITHAVTKGLDRNVELRDSEVQWMGSVPAHWLVDRIKHSVDSARNGIWGAEPDGGSEDIRCVRVADFDRPRLAIHDRDVTFRRVTSSERQGRILRRGDLILEKSGGGDKSPVGFVVIYDEDAPAVCSNFVARIQLSPNQDPKFWTYVHHCLYQSRLTYPSIKQNTGIQNLDQQSYFNERVGFPPFDEQREIADFLDSQCARIDSLIGKSTEMIETLREYRSALITDAVTGKIDVREAV
ncbi:restriction endonuclease subunit S [Dietzia sp. KRD202]|uniref:restriction endonuclease subunit S n=1 Tax=Dietzia sp. KRD202 TaxID=2729732 RepID=UPI0019D0AA4D|nr:restriction endonuclease subunit S [Dietzia sp. KRD202]